jgi:hypothetical protein
MKAAARCLELLRDVSHRCAYDAGIRDEPLGNHGIN